MVATDIGEDLRWKARQEQIRRAAHAGEAILDASVARRLKAVFVSDGVATSMVGCHGPTSHS